MAKFAQRTLTGISADRGIGPSGKAPWRSEIAFIDLNVDDLRTLLAGLRPDIEAIVLDEALPAPTQIARALHGRSGLDAIHVVAHGRPGEVSFAAGALSLGNLPEHAGGLERIGAALGEGSINPWSCVTRKGESGQAFVEAFAKGVRISASEGLIGAAGRGGAGSFGLELPAHLRDKCQPSRHCS